MDEGKMRTLKRAVEQNSETIERMVDQLVAKYNSGLKEFDIRQLKKIYK